MGFIFPTLQKGGCIISYCHFAVKGELKHIYICIDSRTCQNFQHFSGALSVDREQQLFYSWLEMIRCEAAENAALAKWEGRGEYVTDGGYTAFVPCAGGEELTR